MANRRVESSFVITSDILWRVTNKFLVREGDVTLILLIINISSLVTADQVWT